MGTCGAHDDEARKENDEKLKLYVKPNDSLDESNCSLTAAL